jgi:hypothetical protein
MAPSFRPAWEEAARDLGIRVAFPEGLVHVLDFGGPAGVLCMPSQPTPEEAAAMRRLIARDGLYSSTLFDGYAVYDRELFTATLDDWAWYGRGEPPDWYTGKPWS